VSGEAEEAGRLLALVAQLQGEDPLLTGIEAALIAAADTGLAGDSRTFARRLGLAHALVLRALNALAERGRIRIDRRDARTMRTHYSLGPHAPASAIV
jgi:predicted outer membrane protein